MSKKKEVEKEEKDKKKSKGKELYWIFGAIVFLLAVFFSFYYIFGSLNTIEYEGLTFTKEKFGDIPVFHHYYYISPQIKYNLYLRNDPRKNTVPFTGNAVEENIEFSQNSLVYISLAPEALVGCEYGSVGISTLSSFLSDNQLNVKGASTDKELAELNDVAYITCDNIHPSDSVIVLENGEETKVIHEENNCYTISVANCEVLEAIEKFEVQAVLDARIRTLES